MGFLLSPHRRRYSNLLSIILATNLVLALVLEMCCVGVAAKLSSEQQYEDNEFAEFEEIDEEVESVVTEKIQDSDDTDEGNTFDESNKGSADSFGKDSDESESTVEDEEDDEEFENVSEFDESGDRVEPTDRNAKKPDLKITKVPLHLRSNWESYYLEFLMIGGLVVYFLNFIAGRSKNQKMADTWFEVHKDLLYSNFALVGDDGKKEIENPGLIKETESVFTLWCSGRVCVEGMLVELKFLKRQDLVNVLSNYFKPSTDQIVCLLKIVANLSNLIFAICLNSWLESLWMQTQWTVMSSVSPAKKALKN